MAATERYDYVIVGAGSAGCVLANRLTDDPGRRVLLLEAGPPDKRREVSIPAAWVSLFKTEVDWQYETVPQPQLDDRVIYWPRGKMLGGSSSINAQIYLRGARADFDEWAAEGNRGWSYADVLPYFIRSEHNESGNGSFHGTDGPLWVSNVRDPNPLSEAFLQSGITIGLPRYEDFNAEHLDGIGYCQHTRRHGRRCSTSAAFLKPVLSRKNLDIWTESHATKLICDGRQVIGVTGRRQGQPFEVRARREVILCGGAVNSPALLMQSGIGPPEELRRHEIDVVHALGGVGRNLQDHPIAPILYRSLRPVSLLKAKSLGNVARYLIQGRGMLAGSGVDVLAHVRTRPELVAPDLQVLMMAVMWLDQGLRAPEEHGFTIGAAVLKPGSRGSITLQSDDPLAPPVIQPNYCSDEAGEDLRILIEGFRLGRRIVAAAAFDDLRGPEIAPGIDIDSDAALQSYISRSAQTYFHPVGTCRMGIDAMGVVDPELRVHGLEGLRVVDASVMPSIPRANTNAATIMIAEKAADLIKG